ncbi:hypothetical protein EGK58_011085 [Acinetobacter variabilis]|uniref:hypothetical protein n=1 Tax=Acinetobacter variabilis TaxID=70346 RepID=UPI000F685803|nr:hypothetical protein [Acinetobacter variabilis]QXR18627.1 hypothetical protein EGK58_011085 [Acinetobacter variabilis]
MSNYIILFSIILIILVFIIGAYQSKKRKSIKPRALTVRESKLANLADGIELIFTPIFWIIKLMIGIFKS